MQYTIDDFLRSVVPSDVPFMGVPCWIWVGRRDEDGYGWLPYRGGARDVAGPLAHRFAMVVLGGRGLPGDRVVDHICKVRSCVNPAHLRVVRARQNTVGANSDSPSAQNKRKTHCVNGHEFTPENTKINRKGHRQCRACDREYQLAYQRRRRYELRSARAGT